MARNPGYLVEFITKEQKRQKGRTFHSNPPINGKVVVYYLTDDFKEVYEIDSQGAQVWKKRLIPENRLVVRGMCD